MMARISSSHPLQRPSHPSTRLHHSTPWTFAVVSEKQNCLRKAEKLLVEERMIFIEQKAWWATCPSRAQSAAWPLGLEVEKPYTLSSKPGHLEIKRGCY
jgi:hypothetical protein